MSAPSMDPPQALLRRVSTLCVVATLAVAAIDFSVWQVSGDRWKLGIAVCMTLLALLFSLSLALQRLGRPRAAVWAFLGACPLTITWVMIAGGASIIIPTLIAAVAMLLALPETIMPGAVSPRVWLSALLGAYFLGIALRVTIRGLDFAGSHAEFALLVLVPGVLILIQWLLIQRVFGVMRVSLAESEELRGALEQRNRDLIASSRALERASTAKSQFLANMSHELRTPLNIILGYTELLREELAETSDAEPGWDADLAKIGSASVHLLAVISDILDLSKIEAGKTDLMLERTSLPHLIQQIAGTTRPLIDERHNQLQLDIDPRLGDLDTDPVKLRQILFNLLANAGKFTDRGTITLRARLAPPAHFLLEVEDTGIGIAEEAQQRIFDAFEQADPSSTRNRGGTGLGLTLVRRLSLILGGEITVESELGRGSCFTVRLPLQPPAHPVQSEQSSPLL